jgi:hypothetical protein
MSGRRHAPTRAQRHPRGEIVDRRNVGQPFVEHRRPARIGAMHLGAQCIGNDRRGHVVARRRASRHRQAQQRRRRFGQRRAHGVGIRRQRGETLAQHRLDRGFPAGIDADRSPQGLRVGQPARPQPGVEIAALCDFRLQLRQRLVPRAGFGQPAMRRLQCLARLP